MCHKLKNSKIIVYYTICPFVVRIHSGQTGLWGGRIFQISQTPDAFLFFLDLSQVLTTAKPTTLTSIYSKIHANLYFLTYEFSFVEMSYFLIGQRKFIFTNTYNYQKHNTLHRWFSLLLAEVLLFCSKEWIWNPMTMKVSKYFIKWYIIKIIFSYFVKITYFLCIPFYIGCSSYKLHA